MASDLKSVATKSALHAARAYKVVTGASLTGVAANAIMGASIVPALGAVTVTAVGLVVEALTKKYSSFQVNEKTAPVEPVSDTWKKRPKANMVKWMMRQSGVPLEQVAEHLGCTVSYLNTKLARDSFSFEDLILVAYACGYTFTLADNNGDGEAVYRVDIIRHFENSSPEVLERLDEIEAKAQVEQARREEYETKLAALEKKKAELEAEFEQVKQEYGFED